MTSERPRDRAGAAGLFGVPPRAARGGRDAPRGRAAPPGGADRRRQEPQLPAAGHDPHRHDAGRVAARGADGRSGRGARDARRARHLSRLDPRGGGDAAPHGGAGAARIRARVRGAGAARVPGVPRPHPRDRLPAGGDRRGPLHQRVGPRLPSGIHGDRRAAGRPAPSARAGVHGDGDADRARRDPGAAGLAARHTPDGPGLRSPQPGAARRGGRRPPRARAARRRRAHRGARRSTPRSRHGPRLHAHAQAGRGRERAALRARLAGPPVPRRPGPEDARGRAARLRRGRSRHRGGDQRLRHGNRPPGRSGGDPPRSPRVDRGVLPGGRPGGARRRAGARAAPDRRARPAAAPGAARARRRRHGARPRRAGAQVEHVPRADPLGGGRQLPPRRDLEIFRRRGRDARGLRALRRVSGPGGEARGGRPRARYADRPQGAVGRRACARALRARARRQAGPRRR